MKHSVLPIISGKVPTTIVFLSGPSFATIISGGVEKSVRTDPSVALAVTLRQDTSATGRELQDMGYEIVGCRASGNSCIASRQSPLTNRRGPTCNWMFFLSLAAHPHIV